ncbi:glycogen debranching protein GlgX [Ilumatobacter sp.]|uniref:glycogen debranching protein GlgX n=1 Tax=Ilumatobacter sp. TaxID=1967498 RepID=UPI003AF75B0A
MTTNPTFGAPHPLGVRSDGTGVNAAVWSETATVVELCLFDDDGNEERIALPERTAHVHHGHVAGIRPGQRYGLRVDGPWNPADGLRHNPAKLLVDPYALAIEGDIAIGPEMTGHEHDDPSVRSEVDSAPMVPKCVVIDEAFDWEGDTPPGIPMNHTVIYEAHVRGLSKTHPDVPAELRGTYAGMAHPAIVNHLLRLGVTAVELLPVHHFLSEGFLDGIGLSNYWGYSTIGFLAPHSAYAATGERGEQVVEFKQLVKALHRAGIEVILDVVYNHTNEGNEQGPTLSLRGIDNAAYYRLPYDDRRRYVDFTGTGNSLNVEHPAALRLVMDSLRYWVTDMHVDGFRFDLATTLARDSHEFDRHAAFFDLVHQDPVVSQVKLIAEPWDVGPGGYQLGSFPPPWSEWNARFRDDVRDFWKGTPGTLAAFAGRFTGSADVFHSAGRRPSASINFITAHDGYTLADLVSYEQKHNEANGEENRDGHSDNRSWNGGVEGPTRIESIIENRRRRSRSMLATLVLSQGVPMVSGGDEIGRTQRGNNNAYCQDNELSWHDWDAVDHDLLAFTQRLIALRKAHPVFRRRRFFEGAPTMGSTLDDIGWFRPDGDPMHPDDWHVGHARALSVFLNGNALGPQGETLERPVGHSFLVLCNAGSDSIGFTVPVGLGGSRWRVVVDTSDPTAIGETVETSDDWKVGAWSLVLLERDEIIPGSS